MFKEISWLQFFGTLMVVLIFYYAYVGWAYYQVELKAFLSGKSRGKGRGATSTSNEALASSPEMIEQEETEYEQEYEQEEEDAEEQPAPISLPVHSLENLSAVTKPAPEKSTPAVDEEAEETYDDEPTNPVGESTTSSELDADSPAEKVVTEGEPILSVQSTTSEIEGRNEEATTIISENDKITADSSTFETDEAPLPVLHLDEDDELLVNESNDIPDHSISLTTLTTHLDAFKSGEINTAEELMEREPNLSNTDLLADLMARGADNAYRNLRSRNASMVTS